MTDENQAPNFFTEAPASATVKVTSAAGFDWLLTTRANTSGELLERLYPLEAWLKKHNWQPAHGRPQVTANGSAAPANGNAPACQYHGPMKRSTKFDGWFCPSKMGDGSYCKEQVKD